MSSYVNFYAHKNKEFISLGSFSRALSVIYRMAQDCYFSEEGKLKALTRDDISKIRRECVLSKADREALIDHIMDKIEWIKDAKIEDKLEVFEEFLHNKEDIIEEIGYINNEINFLDFLDDIILENQDDGVTILWGIEVYEPNDNSIL